MRSGYWLLILLAAAIAVTGCGKCDEETPTGAEPQLYGVHAVLATREITDKLAIVGAWQEVQLNAARWQEIRRQHGDIAPFDTLMIEQAKTIHELEAIAESLKVKLPRNSAAEQLEPTRDFAELEVAFQFSLDGMIQAEAMFTLLRTPGSPIAPELMEVLDVIDGRMIEMRMWLDQGLEELMEKRRKDEQPPDRA